MSSQSQKRHVRFNNGPQNIPDKNFNALPENIRLPDGLTTALSGRMITPDAGANPKKPS